MSTIAHSSRWLASAPLASDMPTRVVSAQWLVLLFSTAIVAVFLGWVLARWMRLRHIRLTAAAFTAPDHADAWTEAARRLGADNDNDDTADPDPPPDQQPPRNPDTRWRS